MSILDWGNKTKATRPPSEVRGFPIGADVNASKVFTGATVQEAANKAEAWTRDSAQPAAVGIPDGASGFRRRARWEATGHCPLCSSPIFAFVDADPTQPPVVHRSCQCKNVVGNGVRLNNGAVSVEQVEITKAICAALYMKFTGELGDPLKRQLIDKFQKYIHDHDEETIRGQQMDEQRREAGKEGGNGG